MKRKSRILVVEDDSIIREDIQRSLKTLGYPVAGAFTCAEEALAEIESIRPDLVLMDIVLQGRLNGIEAACRIRSQFHVPVVFLTAYSDAITLARAEEAKPAGFIFKPFSARELDDAIRRAAE